MTSQNQPEEKDGGEAQISEVLRIPFGQLGVIALDSCRALGEKVDRHLVRRRAESVRGNFSRSCFDSVRDSYLVPIRNIRFQDGSGKAVLGESVRGKDLYILADVGNYSCTYELFGVPSRMGPDEHFQDIKRTIAAVAGTARRVSVLMPMLYAGRQHKRKGRESLDCAIALQELERLGVDNIVTFDAHDPRVQNAVPLIGFESLHSTYGIIKALLDTEKGLNVDGPGMMVISPDTGAMDKAIYYAGVLGLDVGLFYKRRDPSLVVNGRNPIIEHEYMGPDVGGRDVLIVDDMIASGESILDIVDELKARGVRDVYVAATFGLFAEGTARFNDYFARGLIKRVYSTNLTYIPEALSRADWHVEVDMSLLTAALIDRSNYDESISSLFDSTERIQELLEDR